MNNEVIYQSKVLQHKRMLFMFCSVVISLFIRYLGKDFVSGDMKVALLPWFEDVAKNGGIKRLADTLGDYPLSYDTLIALLSYINFKPLYLIKLSSMLFDYILAVLVAIVVKDYYKRYCAGYDKKLIPIYYWAFTITLLVPTVFVNSSYWGQCDAMYASYCLGTLICVRKKLYVWAAISLGFAFACKLQSIFIIPFLFAYILKTKEYKVFLYLPVAVLSFWLTGIFAYIQGRDLFTAFDIYIMQSGLYQEMYLNFASFWGIFGKYTLDYSIWSKPAIILAIVTCIAGLIHYIKSPKYIDKSSYYAFAAWSVWTVVLLLPSMHERYAFMADILLVILSFMNYRYIPFAVLSVCMSLWCYCLYFFGWDPPHGHPIQSFIYTVIYISFTYTMLKEQRKVQIK